MDDVKKLCFVFFIVTVINQTLPAQREVTLPIEERIKLLKYAIKEQIAEKRPHRHHHHHNNKKQEDGTLLNNEQYDYVEMGDNSKISPILDNDERKKHYKYKLRELKTVKTTEATIPPATTPIQQMFPKGPMRSDPLQLQPKVEKPVDKFYRRYFEIEKRNEPVEWLHCQDMIKPYVLGINKELKSPFKPESRSIKRFLQLLSENLTVYEQEDIKAHMYQVSNINVRLFQWDLENIRKLMSFFTGGKKHSFLNLKYGIKETLDGWHLDYSNTSILLEQARIFRPPCIHGEDYIGGSTKSSGASRYDKPTQPTTSCKKKKKSG